MLSAWREARAEGTQAVSFYTSQEIARMADACLASKPLSQHDLASIAIVLVTFARIELLLSMDNPKREESLKRLSRGDFWPENAFKEVEDIVARLRAVSERWKAVSDFLAKQGDLFAG